MGSPPEDVGAGGDGLWTVGPLDGPFDVGADVNSLRAPLATDVVDGGFGAWPNDGGGGGGGGGASLKAPKGGCDADPKLVTEGCGSGGGRGDRFGGLRACSDGFSSVAGCGAGGTEEVAVGAPNECCTVGLSFAISIGLDSAPLDSDGR